MTVYESFARNTARIQNNKNKPGGIAKAHLVCDYDIARRDSLSSAIVRFDYPFIRLSIFIRHALKNGLEAVRIMYKEVGYVSPLPKSCDSNLKITEMLCCLTAMPIKLLKGIQSFYSIFCSYACTVRDCCRSPGLKNRMPRQVSKNLLDFPNPITVQREISRPKRRLPEDWEVETELHGPTLDESASCVNCGGDDVPKWRICFPFLLKTQDKFFKINRPSPPIRDLCEVQC
ncbi:hypothetical protein CEXT_473881 [Caerostris extrusa]|uniref:Uncharacterized protein n=1 Tax=Caerostris extrusa TaxID=172846 RepID=A0AAV4UMV5_CAEEX|nr:hypothetical protein CEXT_473881 [Caerostris extrusa]